MMTGSERGSVWDFWTTVTVLVRVIGAELISIISVCTGRGCVVKNIRRCVIYVGHVRH